MSSFGLIRIKHHKLSGGGVDLLGKYQDVNNLWFARCVVEQGWHNKSEPELMAELKKATENGISSIGFDDAHEMGSSPVSWDSRVDIDFANQTVSFDLDTLCMEETECLDKARILFESLPYLKEIIWVSYGVDGTTKALKEGAIKEITINAAEWFEEWSYEKTPTYLVENIPFDLFVKATGSVTRLPETLAIKEKVLTKKMAAKYQGDKSPDIELKEITRVDDAAAVILGQLGYVHNLYLNGVLSISANVANHIVGSSGCRRGLYLGLTHLNPAVAEALGRFNGGLYLRKLTTISDDSAKELSNQTGELDLSGIVELTETAARALATHKGGLNLGGLVKLSDEAACALSNHKGRLEIGSIVTITNCAAEALAKHEGDLIMQSLETLSVRAAAAFSLTRQFISLPGLKTLTPVAAKQLFGNKNIYTRLNLAKLAGEPIGNTSTAKAIPGRPGFYMEAGRIFTFQNGNRVYEAEDSTQ